MVSNKWIRVYVFCIAICIGLLAFPIGNFQQSDEGIQTYERNYIIGTANAGTTDFKLDIIVDQDKIDHGTFTFYIGNEGPEASKESGDLGLSGSITWDEIVNSLRSHKSSWGQYIAPEFFDNMIEMFDGADEFAIRYLLGLEESYADEVQVKTTLYGKAEVNIEGIWGEFTGGENLIDLGFWIVMEYFIENVESSVTIQPLAVFSGILPSGLTLTWGFLSLEVHEKVTVASNLYLKPEHEGSTHFRTIGSESTDYSEEGRKITIYDQPALSPMGLFVMLMVFIFIAIFFVIFAKAKGYQGGIKGPIIMPLIGFIPYFIAMIPFSEYLVYIFGLIGVIWASVLVNMASKPPDTHLAEDESPEISPEETELTVPEYQYPPQDEYRQQQPSTMPSQQSTPQYETQNEEEEVVLKPKKRQKR